MSSSLAWLAWLPISLALASTSRPQSFLWPSSGYRNDFKLGRVYLDPKSQNIPTAAAHAGFRPPIPRIPDVFDLFLGLPAYRDGKRCGFTLFSAFFHATNPYHIHAGVVDQTQDDDIKCIREYCRLAHTAWPDYVCKYRDQITIDARDSRKSDGPISVRAGMQKLIKNEEFCLTTDAHMQFLPHWDTELLIDWNRTQNEMAVLSTYVFGYEKIGPNNTVPASESSHLCCFGGHGSSTDMPWMYRLIIENSELPQMSPFWGGGLSFSKCHAEKRAPIDPHMTWIFLGEEYLRAMQLWTQGYDIYSPSRHGLVLFHNETKVHTRDNWQSNDANPNKAAESALSFERLKMVLNFQVTHPANAKDLDKYYPRPVRSVRAFLNFTGISPSDTWADRWQCEQMHWVPYEVPEIVEAFLPGYQMRRVPSSIEGDPELAKELHATRAELKQLEEENRALLRRVEVALRDGGSHADAGTKDGQMLQEIRDALLGGSAKVAEQDSNAQVIRRVEALLVQLHSARSVGIGDEAKTPGNSNFLMDYKEVIAIQLGFVVLMGVFCVWRSRKEQRWSSVK
ncbi:Aste57867_4058 [Aphanomyces stellatus]|uniref:Aste57867_4058 protein n=1 Tax=Aphanomyces stellatus TaxID=120398 RepID=A0A485KFA5_9STRA|nr:hypothetical protein As57867_004047 [Aphanomyces stellatus]VFT81192.1 Aste57867_4058 [Aphanomyces stellatus]